MDTPSVDEIKANPDLALTVAKEGTQDHQRALDSITDMIGQYAIEGVERHEALLSDIYHPLVQYGTKVTNANERALRKLTDALENHASAVTNSNEGKVKNILQEMGVYSGRACHGWLDPLHPTGECPTGLYGGLSTTSPESVPSGSVATSGGQPLTGGPRPTGTGSESISVPPVDQTSGTNGGTGSTTSGTMPAKPAPPTSEGQAVIQGTVGGVLGVPPSGRDLTGDTINVMYTQFCACIQVSSQDEPGAWIEFIDPRGVRQQCCVPSSCMDKVPGRVVKSVAFPSVRECIACQNDPKCRLGNPYPPCPPMETVPTPGPVIPFPPIPPPPIGPPTPLPIQQPQPPSGQCTTAAAAGECPKVPCAVSINVGMSFEQLPKDMQKSLKDCGYNVPTLEDKNEYGDAPDDEPEWEELTNRIALMFVGIPF